MRDDRLTEAWQLLNGGDWWGGGDSIAMLNLEIEGGFTARARQDSRTLRESLVELHQILAEAGQAGEDATLIAAELRKWVASRM